MSLAMLWEWVAAAPRRSEKGERGRVRGRNRGRDRGKKGASKAAVEPNQIGFALLAAKIRGGVTPIWAGDQQGSLFARAVCVCVCLCVCVCVGVRVFVFAFLFVFVRACVRVRVCVRWVVETITTLFEPS